MSYRIKYTIEEGLFEPVKRDDDLKPIPGVRIHQGDPNTGYTDSLTVCSVIMEMGEIASVLWAVDPKLRADQVRQIREQFDHYLEEHLGITGD